MVAFAALTLALPVVGVQGSSSLAMGHGPTLRSARGQAAPAPAASRVSYRRGGMQAAPPPTVTGESSQNVTDTAATLVASINPNGTATTYVIDYGTTTAYGQQTVPIAVGSATSAQAVSQTITGLIQKTTYHFQFVATNAGGTTHGPDATFTTAATPAPATTTTTTTTTTTAPTPKLTPPPVKGVSVDFFPYLGTVSVNGHLLKAGEQIPFGAVVNTLLGTVVLESISPTGTLQSARFSDAIFQILSLKDGVTELVLRGGDFGVCASKGTRLPAAVPKKSKAVIRSLWGNGHGQFLTKGRYAAAAVLGTIWETVDRCDGTLIRVKRGTVSVVDLIRKKTHRVTAGHTFLVRP